MGIMAIPSGSHWLAEQSKAAGKQDAAAAAGVRVFYDMAAGEAAAKVAPSGNSLSVGTAFIAAQEVSAGAGEETPRYDFNNMTRQEIADAGKQLFKEGKITIDELFRFDHPDGKLRIGLDGKEVALDPNERVDFIGATRTAIFNMEQTGEARRADSGYAMMVGLLDKLNMLSA